MAVISPDELPADFGVIDGLRDPRDERIAELEAALAQISSLARFELKTPTQLHETCLHMIAKTAASALAQPNEST